MKPLRDLLLVELETDERKSATGLFIKEAWAKPRNQATVVEVGPQVENVHVGQIITINPYAVIDVTKDQKLIREGDVLAVHA